MTFKNSMQAILSVAGLLAAQASSAALLQNGTFDSGLQSWTDASETGQVAWQNDKAVMSTGAGSSPYSSIFVQGDDGWFTFDDPVLVPGDALFIEFDAAMISRQADATESGNSFFDDVFSLNIYDALDWDYDLLNTVALTDTVQTFSFDVTSLIGRDVALSFELADEDDGFNSWVSLDNVAFFSRPATSVPEPSAFILMMLGIFGLGFARRRK